VSSRKRAWVAATLDTKAVEAVYACALLEATGLPVVLADLSTKASLAPDTKSSRVLISSAEIAARHPGGESAVFCGDRGAAIAAMTDAFERFVKTREEASSALAGRVARQ